MIGTSLAHYRVTARLGAGGMGEVYRATDTRLGREVAIKVLSGELAASPESLRRFRREARAVAALNHPHIVTVFSVEQDAGVHFLTMELVDGRGVDELVGEGGLEREAFFEIAIAFADAVAAAHARGIVHRDLKPANLMLAADGRLKVLDFGLAKMAAAGPPRAASGPLLTDPGLVLGTVPYMSPEQARGDPVDERSDVFSLGSVLHELATGRRPFDGADLPTVLYRVVHGDPPPVSASRPDMASLDPIVAACLVKEVEERRWTAARVRDELRALQRADGATEAPAAAIEAGARPVSREDAPAARTERPRGRQPVIAVLPFRSTSADPETSELAASLGSDVVDGVTNTSQAVVLPESATQRFAGGGVDARSAGEELGAGYVVQGTVRRAGARLRVTAQLVSVETGTQIWSRQYERDLSGADLFEVGDEIGAQIVSAVSDVHGVIFEVERQRLEGRPIAELDPWECIFVTLGYDKFIDVEHHRLATEALERAVELDPGFPLAWGYVSWIATDEHLYGFNARPDSMRRAMAAARRAVELDPRSHMLRWLLARVHFFAGDVEGFLAEANRALELNSSDATVIGLIGLYTSLSGRWRRGEELMRRAMDLNPSYPSYYHMVIGLDRFREGRDEEALAEYRRIAFTGNAFVQGVRTAILARLGRREEAAASLRELEAELPEPTTDAVRGLYEKLNVGGELLDDLIDALREAGLGAKA